ncbi:DUF3224 domain-containing protein [Aestuariibacter sp. A3R04]|uniref:DUF3224 domain-containing protein n=1 Tax=Aestuariibacter sp. A3R04 TaxID=2841571 RepID=UPI001C0A3FCB|nr:DUF3224 domain-containing protein [Aestuariibacter sp. A3R04]MBU3022485.1 DUF3224 domain-containing protein [Aestuariibacter sp. A3R04]
MQASGEFTVALQPVDCSVKAQGGLKPARMTISKHFQGPLTAESHGEMLSVMTTTSGSAGYVAIEIVTGALKGKTGTFALQHFGLMDKGQDSLTLKVIPDSGTDALTGLRGDMTIHIKDGVHYYHFDYQLSN